MDENAKMNKWVMDIMKLPTEESHPEEYEVHWSDGTLVVLGARFLVLEMAKHPHEYNRYQVVPQGLGKNPKFRDVRTREIC